jgi:hypothetical protein
MSHNNIWITTNIGVVLPLEYLDLSHNALFKLHSTVLAQYNQLTYLDLSHNKITKVLSGAFNNLHRLEYLDLSNNFLMTLKRSVFPPEFPFHLTMKMVRNDFQCGRSMEWLMDAMCEQASTGIGPFDWYDVYNVQCGFIPVLELSNDGLGCEYY